jgi:hypothetical protein
LERTAVERFGRQHVGGFVVHCFSADSAPRARAELLSQGFTVFDLPGEKIQDKRSLFEHISRILPSDGRAPGPGLSWDALVDSLCGGIEERSLPAVGVLWHSAEIALEGNLQLLLDAVQALSDAADNLQHVVSNLGRPTILRLFLIGEGPNFPNFR